jgi:hypothetical protein
MEMQATSATYIDPTTESEPRLLLDSCGTTVDRVIAG